MILELFAYTDAQHKSKIRNAIGNNLEEIGVKHFGISVDNLDEFRAAILEVGEVTDIVMGRTGFRYFFIEDPDGNWVEIVEDRRGIIPDGIVVDMS